MSALLQHPNIECRLDADEFHREPCIVVEYVAGGSLDQWLESGRLPLGQAMAWGRQLAGALDYIHAQGVVHRDVKPGNVLVTEDLDVKLGDFGAADRLARRGRLWRVPAAPEGTPEYVSPEQVLGEPGDERADVYGWGVVMYEMLTGHVPLTGPTITAAMQAHLTEVVAPIADIPQAVDVIVRTALRRRVNERYQSAAALIADLDALCGPEDLGDRIAGRHVPSDPPITETGTSELWALARLVGVVSATFVGIAATLITLTIVLR